MAMARIDTIFINYVGRQFAIRFMAFLTFFIIILQMLDLLNESTAIMAAEGSGFSSIVKYILLRAPQIATQFAPFAALLSVVVTLTVLNHRSEIAVMRAAGMSVHRVLFPIGAVCAMIAFAHFTFHEFVTVPSTAKLDYWEANDFAVDLPEDNGTRTNLRLDLGDAFIMAGSAARIGDGARLNNIYIEHLDADGLITGVTEAATAVYTDGRWRLFTVTDHNAETLRTTSVGEAPWTVDLNPDRLFSLSAQPDRTTLPELAKEVGLQAESGAADLASSMTSFLSRFSKPLSTLVMPLLGALAGYGVSRQGAQLTRAVIGAALGFGYFVFENMALALGKLGVIPAFLGAFFPFALFMVVGFAILMTMEN